MKRKFYQYQTIYLFCLLAALVGNTCAVMGQKKVLEFNNALFYSDFRGSFKAFIQKAIQENREAVLDKDVLVTEPIGIKGDFVLKGKGQPTITSTHRWLFWIYEGVHLFEGFNVEQKAANGNAFYTDQKPGIIWTNTLRKITVTGGEIAYNSSRGGAPGKKSGTIIEECDFSNTKLNISIFSQDGPYKFLHLNNVSLKTNVSHNVYAHPNVAINFNKVKHLGAGKLGLHHFSAGGVPGIADYIHINGTTTVDEYSPYQFPKGQLARITNSDLAIYADGNQMVHATNTHFRKLGGAGAWLVSGSHLKNCTGFITAGDIIIENSELESLRLLSSGDIRVANSKIKYMGGGGLNNKFTVNLENTKVDGVALTNINPESRISLRKGSTYKGLYNWKPIKNLIKSE